MKNQKLTMMTIFAPVLKFNYQFCSKKILHGQFCIFVTIIWSFLHFGPKFYNQYYHEFVKNIRISAHPLAKLIWTLFLLLRTVFFSYYFENWLLRVLISWGTVFSLKMFRVLRISWSWRGVFLMLWRGELLTYVISCSRKRRVKIGLRCS